MVAPLRGACRFFTFPWVSLRFTHGYRSCWRYAPNGGLTVEIVSGGRAPTRGRRLVFRHALHGVCASQIVSVKIQQKEWVIEERRDC